MKEKEPKTFRDYETKERRLLIGMLNMEELQVSAYNLEAIGNFARSDGAYITAKGTHRVEAKVRNFSATKYSTHFIEYPKLVELIKWYKDGYRVDYILFFKEDDGTYSALIYNLTGRFMEYKKEGKNPKHIITTKMLPSWTANGGSRCYVEKKILELTPSDVYDTFIPIVPIYDGDITNDTLIKGDVPVITITPINNYDEQTTTLKDE